MTNHPLSFLASSVLKTRSQVKNAKQTDHGVETMPPKGLTEQKGSRTAVRKATPMTRLGIPTSWLQPRKDKEAHELKRISDPFLDRGQTDTEPGPYQQEPALAGP